MFPMAHLVIAKNIIDTAPYISNKSQFLLGSLAPDAVHFRANFSGDIKKASHLCVGDERWGEVTNNEEWAENVMQFLKAHKNSEDIDFILGYVTHILTDMRNNIVFWTPFRLMHQEELKNGWGSKLHKENAAIDFELYRTHPEREEILELFKQADGVDIDNIIKQTEIEQLKLHIFNDQFKDSEPVDLSANTCIAYNAVTDFIGKESVSIAEKLQAVMS